MQFFFLGRTLLDLQVVFRCTCFRIRLSTRAAVGRERQGSSKKAGSDSDLWCIRPVGVELTQIKTRIEVVSVEVVAAIMPDVGILFGVRKVTTTAYCHAINS
ncbi:unnamed protein product [Amoebophrya sp. A25]|nr:unnamed protein product [Amoebophrya sp. A25]|eukprot:GSA25T00014722001.1